MTRTLHALATLAIALGLAAAGRADDALPDGFYRYPSIGGGTIVFASEGDLWKVPVPGGVAMRLTAYEGEERFPKVSPDGRLVAFTAQYEGNDDVYVMPATGGEPSRLTLHPASDQALGWTADGRVLFRSRRDTPNNDNRVYAIAPTGGIPELIPLEPAGWLSFEPGGKRIALQKMALEFHNWKRYKGGEAEKIEVGTLDPLRFETVTPYDGKNAFPMWAPDGRIYFVTDRWGRPNLASMKPDGGDVRRLTRFEDYDVRWPSMGGTGSDAKIVYQHAMDLWIHDIATGQDAKVPVQLPSDRIQVREKFVDPMASLGTWGLAWDGERMAVEARGDVFVARTKKKGLIRRITESSKARTKFPGFSPDGKLIAAWTEVDGEEQLVLLSADNSAATRQLGTVEPGWHFPPAWSPDGKSIAWSDEKLRLHVTDVASGKSVKADEGQWEIRTYAWSPDSRYLAYNATLENELDQVRVYDTKARQVHAITDPMFNSYSPTWDPKGRYLYFLADRQIDPRLDRLDSRFIVTSATLPYVVALQADGSLPFGPRSDVDPPSAKEDDDDDAETDEKSGDGDRSKPGKAKGGAKKAEVKKVEPVRIDFEGIGDRVVQVPVKPGNYDGLVALEDKLHWASLTDQGMFPPETEGGDDDRGADVVTYDVEHEKLSTLTSGVLRYAVSGDGKVLVFQTKDGFSRVEAGATSMPKSDAPDADTDTKVALSGWSLRVNPRQEWAQMLREAWRLERDFFYDPDMHGVDWDGVWKQYGSLADRLSSRDDLADLLGEMFGELNVGHAYHWGGDLRRGKSVGTGLLAADLKYDDASGFWRIEKIYGGDPAVPGWTSPLARPDLRVHAKQWLVAIDGKPLVKGEDYLRRLANRGGQEVELSIADQPKLEGARRVVVKTVKADTRIRYATWIRENRARVAELSHGQVGYIHLYDMGGLGLMQFARDYAPQWNKRGLVMDDRWNHGGFVAPMILAHLDRKVFAVGSARRGLLTTTPDRAFHGHLACLINRQGGSDCETFAQGFKDYGLGPVIGTRTWGGWVGIRGDKPLRDGGMITEPEFGGWDPAGKAWRIEGHGVDPDVVLDLGPDGLIHGNDVQLERAVETLLSEIAKDPRDLAPRPAIPPRPLILEKE